MTVVKAQFLTERQGKSFVTYPGLLDAAHELGLLSIETTLLQIPGPDNGDTAIVLATVRMPGQDGAARHFSGIGDANPGNVGRMIAPHIIRMAETRAKARALRDAINVGMAAVEELGDDDAPQGRQHETRVPYKAHAADPEPYAPRRALAAEEAARATPARPGPHRGDAAPHSPPTAAAPARSRQAGAGGPPRREYTVADALKVAGDRDEDATKRGKAACWALTQATTLTELEATYDALEFYDLGEAVRPAYEARLAALHGAQQVTT